MAESTFDILYVDDEKHNLEGFKALFRRDYSIQLALSAEAGLDILKNHPKIPIILSDQRMPHKTGSVFFEEISKSHPNSIRILITGYADLNATIDAINKGKIFHYISKPINYLEVKGIIEKAIEIYQLRTTNIRLNFENKLLQLKAEQEEKELIKSQLQNLRSHINPHFLFNSLNILYALIPDNDQAREYVKKLSNVYRYILQSSDSAFCKLQDELDFIKEYMDLQRIRFIDGLETNVNIDNKYLEYTIPNYSMQIIAENIFKHNAVSKDFPIRIFVYVDDKDYLVIKNSMQPKKNLFESSGIGQMNLLERYNLITDLKPVFKKTKEYYISSIPLLPPK